MDYNIARDGNTFTVLLAILTDIVRGIALSARVSNRHFVDLFNHVAFLLGTVHAIRIGTEFWPTTVKTVAVVLALTVFVTFVQKRFLKRKR